MTTNPKRGRPRLSKNIQIDPDISTVSSNTKELEEDYPWLVFTWPKHQPAKTTTKTDRPKDRRGENND